MNSGTGRFSIYEKRPVPFYLYKVHEEIGGHHTDYAYGQADFEPGEERDFDVALLFEYTDGYDVGGRTDHTDVSAKAGAEQEGPPEVGVVGEMCFEALDNRNE